MGALPVASAVAVPSSRARVSLRWAQSTRGVEAAACPEGTHVSLGGGAAPEPSDGPKVFFLELFELNFRVILGSLL